MNLTTEERRQKWQRGRQAYIARIEAYPEFKVLEALVHEPDASVPNAVQQICNITAAASASSESGDVGVHPWHTFTSLIEIVKRNPPARHVKLVECISRLQEVRVTNPRTSEPLRNDGQLVWTQLPTLGYTAADEWHAFGEYNLLLAFKRVVSFISPVPLTRFS